MPRNTPTKPNGHTPNLRHISFTHYATAVHQRTLHRWRQRLRRRQIPTLSEKVFSLSEKRTKTDKVQTKSQPKTNPEPIPDAAMQPTARGGGYTPYRKPLLYGYCVNTF